MMLHNSVIFGLLIHTSSVQGSSLIPESVRTLLGDCFSQYVLARNDVDHIVQRNQVGSFTFNSIFEYAGLVTGSYSGVATESDNRSTLLDSICKAVREEDRKQLGPLIDFGCIGGKVADAIGEELKCLNIPLETLRAYADEAITAYEVEKELGDDPKIIHGRFYDVCLLFQFAHQASQKKDIPLEQDMMHKLLRNCYERVEADQYSGPIVL